MKTGLAFIAMAVAAEAFVAPSSFSGSALARAASSSTSSSLQMAGKNAALETFDNLEESVKPAPVGGGFWFGSAGFWGEEDYRGFVDGYKSDNLLNGVYPIVDRVRETKILTTTAESGLLSALEDAGLTLSEAEKLLPALEESGVLTFAANNLDVLINMFGFIAVEPAKLALPALVSVVKALKGAGLLKLGDRDGAPVASKPVKATKAPKAMKVAAAKVKSFPQVKQAASKVKAAAPSKAAPKVKAAAPSKAQVKAEVKGADKAAKKAVSKAAAKVKAAAPSKKEVKAAPKAAAKAVKAAPSVIKGNIANLPKAL